ncbi:MAG: hypothetical protein JSU78_06765 [Deltaproteobacteria bacterium]|nr:MAG: hypothetical protein JSU78_06765 [Deltaproteobacteria bacterium]
MQSPYFPQKPRLTRRGHLLLKGRKALRSAFSQGVIRAAMIIYLNGKREEIEEGEQAFEFYKKEGRKGERFGDTLEHLGLEYFINSYCD